MKELIAGFLFGIFLAVCASALVVATLIGKCG